MFAGRMGSTALSYWYMHLCVPVPQMNVRVRRHKSVWLLEQASNSSGNAVLAAAEKQKCGQAAAGRSRREQGG